MTRKIGREIGPGERYFEGSLDNAYRSPKAKKEKGPLGLRSLYLAHTRLAGYLV